MPFGRREQSSSERGGALLDDAATTATGIVRAAASTPPRYERAQSCRPGRRSHELCGAATSASGRGRRAAAGGSVVGYLLGRPRERDLGPERVGRARRPRGPSSAELVRDLYAVAAARWVDEGCTSPLRAASRRPTPRSSTPGSGSASAQQHVYAIRETPPGAPLAASRRRASRSGAPTARTSTRSAALELVLPRTRALSPVFSQPCRCRPLEEARAECEDGLRRPARSRPSSPSATARSSALRSAARSRCPRAHQSLARARPAPASSASPPCSPERAGRGVGTALGDDGARLGARAGYAVSRHRLAR